MEYCHGRMPEDGTTKVTEPAAEKDQGLRADCYLADVLDLSRSSLQHDMEKGLVTKEGKPVKASYKVKLGDVFTVVIPPAVSLEAEPEPIPLAILYEDEDVIVVNSPGDGGPPGGGEPGRDAGERPAVPLQGPFRDQRGDPAGDRPPAGQGHQRVMICAKNDLAHQSLAEQIQKKEAKRTYLAIVRGNVKEDHGHIETQLDRDPRDRKKMAVVPQGAAGRLLIMRCWSGTGNSPWSAAGS